MVCDPRQKVLFRSANPAAEKPFFIRENGATPVSAA
jgi:hypothetical protein